MNLPPNPPEETRRVLEAVTIREIEQILEVTDRLGIHRETVAIPLRARHPGGVRRLRSGKIEIVAEARDFAAWLGTLEAQLRTLVAV